MSRMLAFARMHFLCLFFIIVCANLVVIDLMQKNASVLRSAPGAPNGILTLQFNRSQQKQRDILNAWEHTTVQRAYPFRIKKEDAVNGIDIAARQTRFDFLFIVTYLLLLGLCVCRFFPRKWLWPALGVLFAAGWLDVIEDAGILMALKNFHQPAWHIFLPAYLKWILLAIIIGGTVWQIGMLQLLSRASAYLSGLLQLVWRFRIVVAGLAMVFIVLYAVDQGQDLLLIVNTYTMGPVYFLTSISFLALINWYFPKYYDRSDKHISVRAFFTGGWGWEDSPEKRRKAHIARLFGTLTFLLPAAGILKAMQNFSIRYTFSEVHPLLLLLLAAGASVITLHYNWIERIFLRNDGVHLPRFAGFMAACALVIIAPVLYRAHNEPFFLAYLAVDLFVLAFAFLVFTTVRSCLPLQFRMARQAITPFIVWPGIAFLCFFLYVNMDPHRIAVTNIARYITLPLVISAVIFYTFLWTWLLLLGRKYNVQFITFLFIIALVAAATGNNRYHEVHLEDAIAKPRASLEDHARGWLQSRKQEIVQFNTQHPDRSYPVFLVNAYGGGIRAAAWTTQVIGKLDQQLHAASQPDFQHFVFSYSGASGGTIGASNLCAARYSSLVAQRPDVLYERWKDVYTNDYLSPVLAALMGRDMLLSFMGFYPFRDRACLQEELWEKQLQRYDISYGLPMQDYWNGRVQYEVPLLFSNTYAVDMGWKGISAPVALDPKDFRGAVFVNDLVDSTHTLKLSTASFLSARFPYISPTGKIGDRYHFLDGGLKENSGAETSFEIAAVFHQALAALPGVDADWKNLRVQVYFLSLPNSVYDEEAELKVTNMFELTAPFTALMNNRIGNTSKAASIIAANASGHYFRIQPRLPDDERNAIAVLPLGWQISGQALDQMQSSVERDTELKKVLALIR